MDASDADKDTAIRILWLDIHRRTDVIAFVALVLSVMTATFQAGQFMYWQMRQGVALFPPVRMTIMGEPFRDGGATYLSINATMSYVNDAYRDTNSIIKKEYVRIYVNDQLFSEQIWRRLSSLDSDRTGKLIEIGRGSATPFVVAGQSGVSHETTFMPNARHCSEEELEKDSHCTWTYYKKVGEFVGALRGAKHVRFDFFADLYEVGDPLAARCSLDLTDTSVKENIIAKLMDSALAWISVDCFANQ